MPFDDRFGNWHAQMPTEQLAVTDMGSAEHPNTIIGLKPGREPFETPPDVTRAMRDDTRNTLYGPKHIHLQGTSTRPLASARWIISSSSASP